MIYTSQLSRFSSYSDGETPYVGKNGNWWIGEKDTGIKASAVDGVSFSGIEEWYYTTLATEVDISGKPIAPEKPELGKEIQKDWKSSIMETNFGSKNEEGITYKYLWNVEVIKSTDSDKNETKTQTDVELFLTQTDSRVPKKYISYYTASTTSEAPGLRPKLADNGNRIEEKTGSSWKEGKDYSGSTDDSAFLFEISFIEYTEKDENGENLFVLIEGPIMIGKNGSKGEPGKDGKDGTSVNVKADREACQEIGDAYIDQATGHLMILTNLNPLTFQDGGNVQGPAGNGIADVQNYYLVTEENEGIQINDTRWTTTVQKVTSENKYLWNFERIKFTDGSVIDTNPCIIGTYGDDGRGIESVKEFYLVSAKSDNITWDDDWKDTMQVTDAINRYLWNFEEIIYTTGEPSRTKPIIIGVHGEKGEPGDEGAPALPANTSENIRVFRATSSASKPSGPESDLGKDWGLEEISANSKYNYVWTCTGNKKTTYSWKDGTKKEVVETISYGDWTSVELWRAWGGSEAIDTKSYAIYLQLMNGKAGGLEYDKDGKLYVKAEVVVANNISVLNQNNHAVFSASGSGTSDVLVQMGGFTVTANGFGDTSRQSIGGTGIFFQPAPASNECYINCVNYADGNSYFQVRADGTLYAKGAYIEGEGTFTGQIKASSGNVGGWTFNSQGIFYNPENPSDYNNATIGMGVHDSNWAFWAGYSKSSGQANFRVARNGYVYANNAYIEGEIFARRGRFSQCTIDNTCTFNGTVQVGSKINGVSITSNDYGTVFGTDRSHLVVGDYHVRLAVIYGNYNEGTHGISLFGDTGGGNGHLVGNNWTIDGFNSGRLAYFYVQNDCFYSYYWSSYWNSYITIGFYQSSVIYTYKSNGTPKEDSSSWHDIVKAGKYYNANHSDMNLKYDMAPISEDYEAFFDMLKPSSYKYINGTSGRIHTGFVAQEVVTALYSNNLTTKEFAGVYLDDTEKHGTVWSLRRDEFVALNTWQIQKLKPRITSAEQEIEQLKAEVQQLRTELENLQNSQNSDII